MSGIEMVLWGVIVVEAAIIVWMAYRTRSAFRRGAALLRKASALVKDMNDHIVKLEKECEDHRNSVH